MRAVTWQHGMGSHYQVGGDRAGVIMNASRLRQSGFVVPAPLCVPTRLWPEGASLPNSATATRHQGQIAGGSLYMRATVPAST